MTRPAVAAALFVVFLTWRGGAALLALGREASSAGCGSFSRGLDERLEPAIGPDFPLYVALRDHTPPRAECFFLGARDAASSLAYNHVVGLLYPRRFHAIEALPEDWSPAGVGFDGNVHVVAFGPWRALDLAAARFELLAQGPRFRLWRFMEEWR